MIKGLIKSTTLTLTLFMNRMSKTFRCKRGIIFSKGACIRSLRSWRTLRNTEVSHFLANAKLTHLCYVVHPRKTSINMYCIKPEMTTKTRHKFLTSISVLCSMIHSISLHQKPQRDHTVGYPMLRGIQQRTVVIMAVKQSLGVNVALNI